MVPILLARILGFYLIIACVSILINRRKVAAMAATIDSNSLSFYVTGAFTLLLGLIMVSLHNIWTADYRGVVTAFGWLTLIKGATRLLFPDKMISVGKRLFATKFYTLIVIAFTLVGLWLVSASF